MKAQDLGRSRFLNLLFKPAGKVMESRLRHIFQNPERILGGADIRPGQTVLEVGSGTGFFTMPTSMLIGADGRLIAIEPLAVYAARLAERIQAAGIRNVQVLQRDGLETGLAGECVDRALLFGVLPFPTLPLNRLLPEMHRVLKPEGLLAVWQFPIDGWIPGSIDRSGQFAFLRKKNGVHTFRRREAGT